MKAVYKCPSCGADAASYWRLIGPLRNFRCPTCATPLRLRRWVEISSHLVIAFGFPLGAAFAVFAVGDFSSPYLFQKILLVSMAGSLLGVLPAFLLLRYFGRLVAK